MAAIGEIKSDASNDGSNGRREERERFTWAQSASSPNLLEPLLIDRHRNRSNHPIGYCEEESKFATRNCSVTSIPPRVPSPSTAREYREITSMETSDRFRNIELNDNDDTKPADVQLLSPVGGFSVVGNYRSPAERPLDRKIDIETSIGFDEAPSKYTFPPVLTHRHKTFISIIILACAWMTNDVVLAWVHERVPYQSDPLPDLWFSLFPEYQSAIKLTEALLITSLLLALSIMLFHQERWLVSRRVFFISALCYFGRAFCIVLTQVPVPSRRTYCAPRANASSAGLILKRVGETMSGMGMDTLFRPRELCGDLIYSGHTTILFLCYLTVARYAPKRVQWLRYAAQSMALIGVIGILIARKHYTLDVVLAYYVTTRVYWIYHTLADNRTTLLSRSSLDKESIANVFWSPIINFLESDASPQVLPIPNNFGLPCRSGCASFAAMIKRAAASVRSADSWSWSSLVVFPRRPPHKSATVDGAAVLSI